MTTPQTELIRKPISRDLPVKLTEGELAQVAREIGRLNADRQTMEGQAKVSADQWKDRIRGIEARAADLATKAHAGEEARSVECNEVFDYRLGEVRVERVDTGEKLETRPMTTEERQPSLPGPGMDKPKKGKAAGKPANDTATGTAPTEAPPVDPDAPPPEGTIVHDPQRVLDAEKGAPKAE